MGMDKTYIASLVEVVKAELMRNSTPGGANGLLQKPEITIGTNMSNARWTNWHRFPQ